jgi:ADP-ribosylglycohydrolase
MPSRFQGAILGTMVGDAMGKPVEVMDGGWFYCSGGVEAYCATGYNTYYVYEPT